MAVTVKSLVAGMLLAALSWAVAEDAQCAMQIGHPGKNASSHAAGGSANSSTDFALMMIGRFLERPAPELNENVSEHTPLVFMHQARSGGTTMRKLLYNASKKAGLKAHIPCSGGVDCHAFGKVSKSSAVYGGHFCWQELMGQIGEGKKASCLTNFREPQARLMSCYTSRIVKEKKVAPGCMGKLDPEKLRSMLQNYGCVDEPFRRLGQCSRVSHLAGDKTAQMRVWNATLEHLAQCVPVLVDSKDSFKAAVHHFPQFKEAFWAMKKVSLNQNQYMKDCVIPDTHKKVIAELAVHETLLYNAAKQRAAKLAKRF